MREKLEDLDYYKKQVSDLKQQKILQEESRVNLEERTATLTAKLKFYRKCQSVIILHSLCLCPLLEEMGANYTRLKGQLDSESGEGDGHDTNTGALREKYSIRDRIPEPVSRN